MKNKILIVCGDPNSISSELIFKSWKKINKSLRNKIYLIGSFDLLQSQFKKLKYKIKLKKVININEKLTENHLKSILAARSAISKSLKILMIESLENILSLVCVSLAVMHWKLLSVLLSSPGSVHFQNSLLCSQKIIRNPSSRTCNRF